MAKPKGLLSSKYWLTRAEMREGAKLSQEDWLWWLTQLRPKTRADCIDGPRPCPWVSCKYNLQIDVRSNGRYTEPTVVIREGCTESCVLDVVDRYPEGTTQQVIAEVMGGVSSQSIEQAERSALRKGRAWCERNGLNDRELLSDEWKGGGLNG